MKETGLTAEQLKIPPETIAAFICRYTREAGVRELERNSGASRQGGAALRRGQTDPVDGRSRRSGRPAWPRALRPEQLRKELPAGRVDGLAWTEAGGDVLYVEAMLLPTVAACG